MARAAARAAGASRSAGSTEAPQVRDAGEAMERLGAHPRRDGLALLVLVLLVWGCYFPALSGGFVWDDAIFSEEPVIHRWSGLWNIWFSPADIRNEKHYWPLVYTTFWLEHKLWGLAPLGYHLVNVALHLANAVLVWRLALMLGVPGAWSLAALFAVHPLHVESVAWVIARKDLLSALFYLSAALVWVRFTEAPSRGRYCLALGLFTAGLLSKSIVVTLPAALLVRHWWKNGRVTGQDVLRLAPFFVVGLAITGAGLAFYTSRVPFELGYSATERMLIAARALWFYTGKLLWPTDLAVIYPRWEIHATDLLGWSYVAAAAGLAALLWFFRHRLGRGPLAGVAFFAGTLSPVLGFVDYGYMQYSFVADRFQYLAGIGMMAVVVGGVARGAERLSGALRITATFAFVVVLVALGTLTWRQSGIYHDGIAFFSHIVEHNPEAAGAHANLGRTRLRMERFEEAEASLARALELDPRNRTARQNMAELRRKQGHYAEAIESYRAVLAVDPEFAMAWAGMGDALFRLERYEEAIESLDRSVALHPHPPTATARLVLIGWASEKLGRVGAAVRHYERAVAIDPRNAEALDHLAGTRVEGKRYEEALGLYRTMLEVRPDSARTHSNLGATLYLPGRPEEALGSFERALSLDPNLASARVNLERLGRSRREREE